MATDRRGRGVADNHSDMMKYVRRNGRLPGQKFAHEMTDAEHIEAFGDLMRSGGSGDNENRDD